MFLKSPASLCFLLAVVPGVLVAGTTGVWDDGGPDSEWTNASNWDAILGVSGTPGAGTNVSFGTGVANGQNVNVGADVQAGSIAVETDLRSGDFSITGSGNTIELSGTVQSNHESLVTIEPDLEVVDGDLAISSTVAGGSLVIDGSIFALTSASLTVSATNATSSVVLNGSLDSSILGVNFAGPGIKYVTSGGNQFGGSTTVSGGTLSVSGNLPSGNVFVNGGATLDFSGGIFGWSLNASPTDPGTGFNQGTYNTLSVDGTLTGNGVFDILLTGNDFSDTFWNSTQSWDLVSGSGSYDLSSTFSQFSGSGVSTSGLVSDQGQFTLTGTSLSWSPVPEPSNALVVLLLGAGLVASRRRSSSV